MQMKIHDKIRALRTSKGWTQDKMAELLHLSLNGYANIERGDTEMTISRLEQIAKIFDMTYLDSVHVKFVKESFRLTQKKDKNSVYLQHLCADSYFFRKINK